IKRIFLSHDLTLRKPDLVFLYSRRTTQVAAAVGEKSTDNSPAGPPVGLGSFEPVSGSDRRSREREGPARLFILDKGKPASWPGRKAKDRRTNCPAAAGLPKGC